MQFADDFPAMGTHVDDVVEADEPALDALLSVRVLFHEQEAMFSRFRPASLLSRLNRGETVEHPRFAAACRLALEAYEFTGGIFNPMILPALAEAGYDRTFTAIAGGRPRRQAVPGPSECILINDDRVTLRCGGLDLGGLVKGWTVDLAIELLRGRVDAALVNAGGDLRTLGGEDGGAGWEVEVESPGGGVAWRGTLDGALATSTTLRRSWRTADGATAHHLIDPRTGVPARADLAQVSVWGPETWRAECWAKAILIGGGEAARRASAAGYEALVPGTAVSA